MKCHPIFCFLPLDTYVRTWPVNSPKMIMSGRLHSVMNIARLILSISYRALYCNQDVFYRLFSSTSGHFRFRVAKSVAVAVWKARSWWQMGKVDANFFTFQMHKDVQLVRKVWASFMLSPINTRGTPLAAALHERRKLRKLFPICFYFRC